MTCAFLVAFLGTVAMWWIYFNIGAERGSREITGSADPGRYARAVYTYFHIPIVAGIVVSAVADELTIAHPGGHMELPVAIALLGGPALYLAGNVFFKRASAKYYPLSHLVGLGLLAAIAPFALLFTPLALGTATTVVLITVAVWETRSFAGGHRSETRICCRKSMFSGPRQHRARTHVRGRQSRRSGRRGGGTFCRARAQVRSPGIPQQGCAHAGR